MLADIEAGEGGGGLSETPAGVRWSLRGFGAVALLAAILLGLEGSENPIFLLYSRAKVLGILLLSLVATMFFLAARLRRMGTPLLLSLVSMILALSAVELAVRIYPLILPNNLLALTPPVVRARAAALDAAKPGNDGSRRFYLGTRTDDFVIDGLWMRFVPNLRGVLGTDDPEEPFVSVAIDEAGYRNSPGLYSAFELFDVVLLGDSFIFGSSRLTVADWLRQLTGLRVYSLGHIGDGPQHWLLHFPAFRRKKEARVVIANFYEGNDISDALRFQSIIEHGISPTAYWYETNNGVPELGYAGDKWSRRLLRVAHRSALFAILNGLMERPPVAVATFGGRQSEFRSLYAAPPIDRHLETAFQLIENTLAGVKSACEQFPRRISCVVVLSYVPSNATVHGDGFISVAHTSDATFWTESHVRQLRLSLRLARIAERLGVKFIDVTPRLRELASVERLYGGVHFSALGYQRYSEFLWSELRRQQLIRP